jgi:hypothetical protein
MAIRIFSIEEAMRLKDKIPRLVQIRSRQFQGPGYNYESHGYLIVLEAGDDITQIKEIGEDGLFIDDVPTFDTIETYLDVDGAVMEVIVAVDNERTLAIIAEANCLNADLAASLLKHSTSPQPMPKEEYLIDDTNP